MSVTLDYLKKYVYQNAGGARVEVQKFINDKMMSSFPSLLKILKEADEKALDNYDTFADKCGEAIEKVYAEIKNMERSRDVFMNHTFPAKIKERRERYLKDREEMKKKNKKSKEANE